jgi:hypothetical protein
MSSASADTAGTNSKVTVRASASYFIVPVLSLAMTAFPFLHPEILFPEIVPPFDLFPTQIPYPAALFTVFPETFVVFDWS